MDDPTASIDQELAINQFHFLTTYEGDAPPEVSIIAEVKHEAGVVWTQRLVFSREQLEQLVLLLHHTIEHDETGLVWP